MIRILLLGALFLIASLSRAAYQPHFSTAGFYEVAGSGRTVYSINPAWRFHKGHVDGAEMPDYQDAEWQLVSLPHGIELLPMEASGCVNYQGEVWYRKHFTVDASWRGQRLELYFEAIMGKSKVWVNGKLVNTHFGGFLPVMADISDCVNYGIDNVITVMADNSDDPSYPPGKPQRTLDFTYCGGIYRDCWLIKTGKVFITDANEENVTAGGGVFVSYGKVSEALTEMRLNVALRNQTAKAFRGKVDFELRDNNGKSVWTGHGNVSIGKGRMSNVSTLAKLHNVSLWSPDNPMLYRLYVRLKNQRGTTVDGYYIRVGLRSIEFKNKEGFWLNGKPYPEPLIGTNRHQEFAVVGNALPNNLHWRDAKKLRDAGLRVIRNAHYPQDPAFMDACDELGLFVTENTPGWQFWSKEPSFGQRVYSDIRNIVRRDRNRPYGFMSLYSTRPIILKTLQRRRTTSFMRNIHTHIVIQPATTRRAAANTMTYNSPTRKTATPAMPSRQWIRRRRISLANGVTMWMTGTRTILRADGSDMVTIVASITDDKGTVKRLNNEHILFTVEGEGRIVGDAQSFTNPVAVQWGTAPVLIQSTTRPGRIRVRATVVWQGNATPAEGTIELNSVAAEYPLIVKPEEANR